MNDTTKSEKQLHFGIQFNVEGEDSYRSVWFDTDIQRNNNLRYLDSIWYKVASNGVITVGNYRIPKSRVIWYQPIEDSL
jgi:hypothetical protein